MLKQFKADLHIHTCLSPCAELQMAPSSIVKTASEKRLNIIAITDHNSAENVIAATKAAESTGLTVLAGMEVTTNEEVHILAIFDNIEDVLKLQDVVYDNLLHIENNSPDLIIPPHPCLPDRQAPLTEGGWDLKGGTEGFNQVVVNEKNEVLSFNNRLLIAATQLTAYSVVDTIHSLGGLAIASHIDREVFGIISHLGFIPLDLKLDALEISPNTSLEKAKEIFKEYSHIPWITSSDAHHLNDIGSVSTGLLMHDSTFEELCMAIKGVDGRKVIL